ncbi:MAG TPA: amidohydrolase family protein [Pyrinomonadaceae bacterium]|nr:amidohydrolase family protein [Pyrinomonadaceae bacterium]
MNKPRFMALSVLLLFFSISFDTIAQTTADPELLAEITKIKAIDNHAHPPRLVSDGETDNEWDALPFEAYEFTSIYNLPARLRPDNPEFIGAWRALFGYKHSDMSQQHVRELLEAKQRLARDKGDGYPVWVLDQLGIETMFANRVTMGRGLPAPRFRWVSYVDAFMFPLNTEAIRKAHPKYVKMFEAEERLLKRYLAEWKLNSPPLDFNAYLSKVISATLEKQKQNGAIAVKFEAAYLRALDFSDVPKSEAARIYLRHIRGLPASPSDYKKLQDFIFRYIAREAGRVGLAVHMHIAAGAGGQFELSGSNPLLLDSVFNDLSLSKTNFVIVHGGWPFTKEVAFLMNKANVYADFSAQTFLLSPRKLSEVLRDWLELYPEHVLFGTDLFPGTPEIGWEEMGWLTSNTGRQALALALTGMMNDGLITRERARELARLVMRENAIRLYNLGSS